MDNNENKTNFDLSVLKYKELIDLNYAIEEFLDYVTDLEVKLNAMEAKNE